MSSQLNFYVGGYIQLPKVEHWHELCDELDIVDELIQVQVGKEKIYISNCGSVCSAIRNGDSFKADLDKDTILKYEVAFLAQHKEVLQKLKDHFNTDIEVKFGAISYWM